MENPLSHAHQETHNSKRHQTRDLHDPKALCSSRSKLLVNGIQLSWWTRHVYVSWRRRRTVRRLRGSRRPWWRRTRRRRWWRWRRRRRLLETRRAFYWFLVEFSCGWRIQCVDHHRKRDRHEDSDSERFWAARSFRHVENCFKNRITRVLGDFLICLYVKMFMKVVLFAKRMHGTDILLQDCILLSNFSFFSIDS